VLISQKRGEKNMTEEKLPTFEEVKARVGEKKETILEIDGNMIREYCRCIGDTNPKWKNVLPPGFNTTAMFSSATRAQLNIQVPYRRRVDAGGDWEIIKSIKPGDVITSTHEFSDCQDKTSEKGPRALLTFKSTHTNQNGEVVAVSTGRIMSY